MICTPGSTHGKNEPRTLQVRQLGEFLQQLCLIPQSHIRVRRDISGSRSSAMPGGASPPAQVRRRGCKRALHIKFFVFLLSYLVQEFVTFWKAPNVPIKLVFALNWGLTMRLLSWLR